MRLIARGRRGRAAFRKLAKFAEFRIKLRPARPFAPQDTKMPHPPVGKFFKLYRRIGGSFSLSSAKP
jgi:hypothetical protein